MATIDVADSESFEFAESPSLGDTELASNEFWVVAETASVYTGTFNHWFPFAVDVAGHDYSVEFGEPLSFENPSNELHLVAGNAYPLVRARLYSTLRNPLILDWITEMTFEVADAGAHLTSRSCTIVDSADGVVTFDLPAILPPGVLTGRFYLEILDGAAGFLSVPTLPVEVIVHEG